MTVFGSDTPAPVMAQDVTLGGTFFRLSGLVRRSLISIIPGKLVVGDATRGDSQLSSSWTMPDAKGGLLVERAIPSRDTDRGYYSTLETRYQNAIMLDPLVEQFPKPNGADDAAIIFEFADHCYAAFGTDLRELNASARTWDAIGGGLTLPEVPTGVCYFAGNIYIACGDAAHIQVFAGSTIADAADGGAATIDGTHLCVLDTKLYVMQGDGTLQSIVDTGTLTFGSEGSLDRNIAGSEVVRMFIFRDIQGQPVLYAATRRGFAFYDANNKIWHQSNLTIPRHPYGGDASCVFRSEAFYGAGITALKFNLSTTSEVGLDRDDGLPADQDGNLVAFIPGLSWMYAFLKGRDQAVGQSSPLRSGSPFQSFVLPQSTAFSALWATDGNGIWHHLWGSKAPTGVTASAIVTHDGVSRLWWCADATMYSMVIPFGIHNPLHNPTRHFAKDGYHVTPWFDADWAEEIKVAIRLRIGVRGLSATERIRVLVGFDDDEGFSQDLGWVDSSTIASPTGVIQYDFSQGIGTTFYRIRFRFEMERGADDTKSPVLRWFTLNYLKGIDAIYGYDLTLSLMESSHGLTPQQQRALLQEMMAAKTLIAFRYKDREGHPQQRMVRVTRMFEIDGAATDDRGNVQLSLGEVYAH